MATKVIPLIKRETEASEFCQELSNAIEDGHVSDLIVMVRYDDGRTEQMWFGKDSSMRCLGMVGYMAHRIAKYIEDAG
jgi:hypothetical protein